MLTIFMDESGYTGQDLMSLDQPFFTLATHCFSEKECKEYRSRFFNRVQAPELKHKTLIRNGKQKLIIEFLKEISQRPNLVKIRIIDKRYELTNRIVQYVVKPAAKKAGVDLRLKGRDYSLPYYMYAALPQLAGQSFFENLLRRFQEMMIRLDQKSYHLFFDPLFDERYPQVEDKEKQKVLDYFLWHIKEGHTAIGYSLIDQLDASAQSVGVPRSRPLDLAFPTTLTLINQWRRDVAEEITLIHDNSSRMGEVINLLHTFVHPFPPPTLLQLNTDKVPFPVVEGDTYAQDSKKWLGLQIADLLAGATTWWIKWFFEGRNVNDTYGQELNNLIPLFQPSMNRPVIEPTLEDFEEMGLTEEEVKLSDDNSEKLAAFHRMRRYGYFRIFSNDEK